MIECVLAWLCLAGVFVFNDMRFLIASAGFAIASQIYNLRMDRKHDRRY